MLAIELIYERTPRDSLLRTFAAHSMHCAPPLEKHKEGSNKGIQWLQMLNRCPDLKEDLAFKGKSWDGTLAWDDVHRGDYMVPTVPIEQLWEDLILSSGQTKEDIQEAAKKGDRKRKIELQLLDRKK